MKCLFWRSNDYWAGSSMAAGYRETDVGIPLSTVRGSSTTGSKVFRTG